MSEKANFQELSGVGPSTADNLHEAGFDTYRALATQSPGDLADKADIGESRAEDVISAARENADIGGFETAEQVRERRKKIGNIQLRVEEFDNLLGGGFETQSISEVYGEFGAGKSQITHQIAVNTQLSEEDGGVNGRSVFIDTEDTFRPSRIDDMVRGLEDDVQQREMDKRGIEGTPDDAEAVEELVTDFLDKISVSKAYNVNHQMLLTEQANEVCDDFKDTDWPVRYVCIDSLTAHFRSEYVGRGELARRQQKLNKHLSDLDEIANMYNVCCLITNQVQSNPDQMFGDPTKPIGGNVLGHKSTFRMYIKKSKANKRIIELNDAPNLEDGEAVVKVTNDGIMDG